MVSRLNSSIQEKNGKYYVVLGYYIDGKRKQKWVNTNLSIKGNKKKAEEIMKQVVDEFQSKAIFDDSNNVSVSNQMTVSQLLKEWLLSIKHSIAPTTFAEYKRLIENSIIPYFDKLNINLLDLKSVHVQKFYNHLIENKKVSANTVIHYHANLRKALDYACQQNYIHQNPCKQVNLPKKEKFIGSYYSIDELQSLLSIVKTNMLETPVVLTCYYGFRRGEVLGLKWSDIDFKTKTISVTGTITQKDSVQKGKDKIHMVSSVKTESSYRTLPLLDPIESYLLDLKQKQIRNKDFFGSEYITKYEDYVCVQPSGDIIKPSYVTEMFAKFLKKNHLRKIRFHDLRHSCATMLLSLGMSLKDIQVWLGHGDYSTTANIYAHVEFNSKLQAGQQISNALFPDSSNKHLTEIISPI